jgi:hypothetical protein
MPKASLGLLFLPNMSFSASDIDHSPWGQACGQTPQVLHSLAKLGFSSVYSRQLYGQTIMHAPQPMHCPVAMTFFSRESLKFVLLGLIACLSRVVVTHKFKISCCCVLLHCDGGSLCGKLCSGDRG